MCLVMLVFCCKIGPVGGFLHRNTWQGTVCMSVLLVHAVLFCLAAFDFNADTFVHSPLGATQS